MQITDRIAAIESRASAINLSLSKLCEEANVHMSTIQRWQTGECDPKTKNAERILARLEAKLGDHERAIFAELQKRLSVNQARPAA